MVWLYVLNGSNWWLPLLLQFCGCKDLCSLALNMWIKNSFASLQLNLHNDILNATVTNKLRHDLDLCRSVKNVSQHYQSSGLRHHVLWYKFTDAYNKHVTSPTSILQMETMIPRNFGKCSPDHMLSHSIRKQ